MIYRLTTSLIFCVFLTTVHLVQGDPLFFFVSPRIIIILIIRCSVCHHFRILCWPGGLSVANYLRIEAREAATTREHILLICQENV